MNATDRHRSNDPAGDFSTGDPHEHPRFMITDPDLDGEGAGPDAVTDGSSRWLSFFSFLLRSDR